MSTAQQWKTTNAGDSMDESQGQFAKWKKLNSKSYLTLWFHFYDILEKTTSRTEIRPELPENEVGNGDWPQRDR